MIKWTRYFKSIEFVAICSIFKTNIKLHLVTYFARLSVIFYCNGVFFADSISQYLRESFDFWEDTVLKTFPFLSSYFPADYGNNMFDGRAMLCYANFISYIVFYNIFWSITIFNIIVALVLRQNVKSFQTTLEKNSKVDQASSENNVCPTTFFCLIMNITKQTCFSYSINNLLQ